MVTKTELTLMTSEYSCFESVQILRCHCIRIYLLGAIPIVFYTLDFYNVWRRIIKNTHVCLNVVFLFNSFLDLILCVFLKHFLTQNFTIFYLKGIVKSKHKFKWPYFKEFQIYKDILLTIDLKLPAEKLVCLSLKMVFKLPKN